MLEIVASETLMLPKVFLSDRDKRTTGIKEFEQKLLHQIHTFNQAHSDRAVSVASPAIELFTNFALQECVKNSIDAKASKVAVSIYLDNAQIIVLITDDGLCELNHQALSYDEYPYLDALSRCSSKKTDDQDSLGGAGKGLAMSTQYLRLSAKRGTLLAGSRTNKNTGFVVMLASENEPARDAWNTYFAEFAQFASNISSFRQCEVALRERGLRAEEQVLRDRMVERTRQTISDFCTFFNCAAEQPTDPLQFNVVSPVTACP
jgi:hypothetical protein